MDKDKVVLWNELRRLIPRWQEPKSTSKVDECAIFLDLSRNHTQNTCHAKYQSCGECGEKHHWLVHEVWVKYINMIPEIVLDPLSIDQRYIGAPVM